MPGEFFVPSYASGRTLYALIWSQGLVWSTVGNAFVTFVQADWVNYAIPLSERGTAGIYVGDAPAGIAAGTYEAIIKDRAGLNPAAGDNFVAAANVSVNPAAPSLPAVQLAAAGLDALPSTPPPARSDPLTWTFRQALVMLVRRWFLRASRDVDTIVMYQDDDASAQAVQKYSSSNAGDDVRRVT
jgi:hypothetical protein